MPLRFRIVESFAAGSQGEICLAEDTSAAELCVLKRYLEGREPSEEWLSILIKRLHRTRCPNLLLPTEWCKIEGRLHVKYPLVRGGTLLQRLERKGPLTFQEGGVLLSQLCVLLSSLESVGIVHRDLKPENFLLQKGLRLRLADFDLAYLDQGFLARLRMNHRERTRGTPYFMAPEHLRGAYPTTAMDRYAAATVYYQSLCLSMPFGDSLKNRESLQEFRPLPVLTRAQNQHLRMALHPRPANRPASLRDLYEGIYLS